MIDETYIKMCDCPEIQEGHDFSDAVGIIGLTYSSKGNRYYGVKTAYNAMRFVWVPYQHQLQEIVKYEYPDFGSLLLDVREYWCNNGYHPITFDTMEQLWLAFVMSEKFNKTWNGTNWEV